MTQTVDFRFELVFLFSVLVSVICLVTAVVLGALARPSASKRLLKALAVGWGAYLSIVFLVAAATPQRIIPMNQDLCFDDMCFAVVNVQTVPQLSSGGQPLRAEGVFYIVTVRVSNHARGRAMSEQGLHALLWSGGHEYQTSSAGQSVWDAGHPQNASLTTRLRPGQSVLSDHVFDVGIQASGLGLVLDSGFTPGYFVIGECPLFHNPTILRLSR